MGGFIDQASDILSGMSAFLPDQKITIGVLVVLAILTYIRGRTGILIFMILATILFAQSFFSVGDFYSMTFERAMAGIVLGCFIVFIDLYLLVTTISDWR